MKEEDTSKKKKIKSFLKNNMYYITLGGLILVFALVIGLSSIKTTSGLEEEQPVNTNTIVFVNPVASATITKGYSATELQYNAILNEWSIHKAVDFSTSSGTNVVACYAGKIESITTDLLNGTTITINHGNNLKTVYKSLDEQVNVSVGQTVETGAIIGKVSASATGETSETSQVHFEVWKDDNLVDPAGYLDISSTK